MKKASRRLENHRSRHCRAISILHDNEGLLLFETCRSCGCCGLNRGISRPLNPPCQAALSAVANDSPLLRYHLANGARESRVSKKLGSLHRLPFVNYIRTRSGTRPQSKVDQMQPKPSCPETDSAGMQARRLAERGTARSFQRSHSVSLAHRLDMPAPMGVQATANSSNNHRYRQTTQHDALRRVTA